MIWVHPSLLLALLFSECYCEWGESCGCWLTRTIKHDLLSTGSRADEPHANNPALRSCLAQLSLCGLIGTVIFSPEISGLRPLLTRENAMKCSGEWIQCLLSEVCLWGDVLSWGEIWFSKVSWNFPYPERALLATYPMSVQIRGTKFARQPWTDDFLSCLHKRGKKGLERKLF